MAWGFDNVFIVRHGETEWNVQGRRQGQLDSPLTQAGRSSAYQVSELLSDLDPDALFSSPLGRAWSTALIIAAALGLGVRSEGGLSEIDHGELGGLINDEIEKSHPGLLSERRACLHRWRFPGGESYADGDLRAAAALSRIETTLTQRPVLVTHEMIARMLVRNLLGLSTDEALDRSFTQGTVYQVTPMRGIWRSLEKWSYRPIRCLGVPVMGTGHKGSSWHRAYTPLVPGKRGETLLNMMFFIERFTLNRAWSDLSEDEFFWEPAPNCWSVRRKNECSTPNAFGAGEWVADFDGSVIRASMEGKGVEPLTTIAWLFWHVGSMPGRATDLDFLGGTKSAESGWTAPYMSEHPVFSAPAEAVDVMRTGWRELSRAIRTSADDGLDQATRFWSYSDEPGPSVLGYQILASILNEISHHGTQVCTLRDLYRAVDGRCFQ